MVCPVPRSGKLGFVGDYTGAILTQFSRVRNWTFDGKANPQQRRYAGTRYGTQRIPGFTEYSGSFQGFGAVPPLFVGDSFTFIGYTAPTSGVPCSAGPAFSVPALVRQLNITWNWVAENPTVSWEIMFDSVGTTTSIPAFVDPCTDAVYCDDNTCNLALVMKNPCAADAVVDFCNLVSASLTFTANNQPYSNSSTNCQIVRDVGTLDWTLDIVDQNPGIIPTLQADYWFEIGATTSPATKWILKYGFFENFSGYRIDTESNEMISKTNHFAMQAVNCCVPATPVRGSIIDPAGNTLWPYS